MKEIFEENDTNNDIWYLQFEDYDSDELLCNDDFLNFALGLTQADDIEMIFSERQKKLLLNNVQEHIRKAKNFKKEIETMFLKHGYKCNQLDFSDAEISLNAIPLEDD